MAGLRCIHVTWATLLVHGWGRRTAFGHEAVELVLVLGAAQALHEVAEGLLLLFQPAALLVEPLQLLAPVVVEGGVAARLAPGMVLGGGA